MPRINGDFRPIASGVGHLGINAAGATAFDITTLTPFGHIHQLSGVHHNGFGGSGIFRMGRTGMELSNDGGITFTAIATGASTVTSVGVLGDANLTGNVDLASPASGFLTINDTGDASPLLFAVDFLGLSGLYRFPTQGFNGRVVNSITDGNGTEAQGALTLVGASGIVVDFIGTTGTITPGNTLPRCFAATQVSAVTWTVVHNLNSSDVIVKTYDAGSPRVEIIPDDITITDANTVTIRWNEPQDGRVVIVACY